MDLLSHEDILKITSCYGSFDIVCWNIKPLSEGLVGYLGDHRKLTVEVKKDGVSSLLKMFIKCMPTQDKWKTDYIREAGFFRKEFAMLSMLFKEMDTNEGSNQWRAKVLFLKEELFIFEDLTAIGYRMANCLVPLKLNEITAVVETLARYHACSYVYEERKSKTLKRPYRIWEDFSQYLKEPPKGEKWRNAGRKAVVDMLKIYSKYKDRPQFEERIQTVITDLFARSLKLFEPSSGIRNAVIHRDLHSNNIFLRDTGPKNHAILVDFQTVCYCSPMADLSSVLYFNTTCNLRKQHLDVLIDIYYEILTSEVSRRGFEINNIWNKPDLIADYKNNVLFGLTQAAIIVPIVALNKQEREIIFNNPETSYAVNEVSRSEEFIKVAKTNKVYRERVIELFDEIVETYIYPSSEDTQSL